MKPLVGNLMITWIPLPKTPQVSVWRKQCPSDLPNQF